LDELTTQLDELTNNWMSYQTIGWTTKQLDELSNNWMK